MVLKKQIHLDSIIQDDEPLARYIFSKSHFSKDRIKLQAFMPSNGTVSVIRHKGCSEDCILKIGCKIESRREHSLKIVCSILTRVVRSVNGLDVKPDTSKDQHRRHANIINFTKYDDAKIRKSAKKLAERASLLLNFQTY